VVGWVAKKEKVAKRKKLIINLININIYKIYKIKKARTIYSPLFLFSLVVLNGLFRGLLGGNKCLVWLT
jgi:hypothetical protein